MTPDEKQQAIAFVKYTLMGYEQKANDAWKNLSTDGRTLAARLAVHLKINDPLTDEQADAVDQAEFADYVERRTVWKLANDEAERRYRARKAEQDGTAGTWGRIDPAEALKAARHRLLPEIGHFRETATEPPHGVFYAGKINEVHGASEGGKSMFVLHIVAQELTAGRAVVYVDYEDDEGEVYGRLMRIMGVPADLLEGDLFRYHRPNGPLSDAEKQLLADSLLIAKIHHGCLVVFDGVTEGMSLEGLTGRDEQEVAQWHAMATKGLAQQGWGVVVVDHTPHDGERTLGSQHKKSAVTGVSYFVQAAAPLVEGQRGVVRLRVEKDRPGAVRRAALPGKRPQWRGDMVLDSSQDPPDVVLWNATPKAEETEEGEGFVAEPPEALREAVFGFVEANEGCGSGAIREGVKGRTQAINWALGWLIEKGALETRREGHRTTHHVGFGPEENDPLP